MSALRPRPHRDLLDLEEVERRLRPLSRRYLGVRAIPLDHVVGTEGRAAAFTRDFEPRNSFSRERLRSLATAFPDGAFPPIVAVKLGDTYFVIDGHHRVALARRHRAEAIDADVTEFVTRVPLPAGADMVDVVPVSSSACSSKKAGSCKPAPEFASPRAGRPATSSCSKTSKPMAIT